MQKEQGKKGGDESTSFPSPYSGSSKNQLFFAKYLFFGIEFVGDYC